ncbi:MAG: mechanosensitive ion channel family protein [Cyanophyceae cyanobacterium]
MEDVSHQLLEQLLLFLPKLAVSLVVFLAFWLASIIVKSLIRRFSLRSRLDIDIIKLIQQAASTSILIFGAITALGTVGIDVSALVASLGLTGFALGYACRDVLSNLLAGVLILFYRPFQRQDRIAVSGFEGIVTEINLRYTVLQADQQKVLIPNSTLFTNPISVLESKEA